VFFFVVVVIYTSHSQPFKVVYANLL